MKHFVFTLCTLISLSLGQRLSAQTATAKTILGIVDISDEENRLNYSQLFKMVLKDNPATFDKVPMTVDLVEHQSNAAVAMRASFWENSLTLAFYKNGQPCFKDTVLLPRLESRDEIRTTNLKIEPSQQGIVIVGLRENEQEYRQGIRSGDIVQEISRTKVSPRDMADARLLMQGSPGSGYVNVKIKQAATGTVNEYRLQLHTATNAEWARPLQNDQLELVFTAILQAMSKSAPKTGMVFKNGNNFNLKAVSKAKSLARTGKCKSYEQLSISADSRMHALSPSVNLDSIFTDERFFRPKESKKTEAGDASLNVLRYYNFEQNRTFLNQNKNVSDEVKGVVRQMSGPFYNKPGVFANYFIGAKQYEKSGNYSAALNQYYATFFKIDDMIASELVRVKAKKIVLGRISYCSRLLKQTEYAELTRLAQDCLKIVSEESSLKKQDKEYYNFAESTFKLSLDIERSLATQRSEKRNAIIGAVLNAGMGAATFSIDSYTSAAFFVNAANIMDENQTLNNQINSTLFETTQSIEFSLPTELQDDEDSSPFELIATASINYALERATNKTALLNRIDKYATNRPAVKKALESTRELYALNNDRLDHVALIGQLIRTEKVSYRYEKRGLALPEAISVP